MVFELQASVMLLVMFVLLAVKIFAFVNALLYSNESYVAAGKLTKPAWCLILGLGVVIQLLIASGSSTSCSRSPRSSTSPTYAPRWPVCTGGADHDNRPCPFPAVRSLTVCTP